MRSPFARVFFIAATAFFVVQGVRYYPKLPARTKAQWAMLREEYKTAANYWNQHLQTKPEDTDAILALAECFDKLGDQQTAMLIYGTVADYLNGGRAQFEHKRHRDRYAVLQGR
jgi:thioredoxin-like negative regulator of GroEL